MIEQVYSPADIYIMPSLREGWGLPACEASMCGVPVIATEIGTLKEIWTGERGFLVPTQAKDHIGHFGEEVGLIDYQQLADTINFILDNPENGQIAARKARKWMEKYCNPFDLGKEWVELFKQVEKDLKGESDAE